MILNSCFLLADEEALYFDGVYNVINNSSDTIYWTFCSIEDRNEPKCLILDSKYETSPYCSYKESFHIQNMKDAPFEQIDIWKKSTLEKYTKEYIKEHDIVDKRYIVDYYDLEKLKFQIVYDGTE